MILKQLNFINLPRILLYPITYLITSPFSLLITLWNLRVLGDGRWKDFSMFSSVHGMNRLFCYYSADELMRWGRRGKSLYIGDGNYELSRWFFYSIPSLYIFNVAPNISVIFGLVFATFSHAIWLKFTQNDFIVFSAMMLFPLGSLFFANIVLQNYNALGWMFFPLFIFGVYTKNLLVSSLTLFLTSFCSITSVFVGNIITILFSIYSGWYAGFLSLIPANLKILTHFLPLLPGNFQGSVLNILRGIGFLRVKEKYRRGFKYIVSPTLAIVNLYYILIFGQFCFVSYYINGYFPLFSVIAIIIFLLNFNELLRFADHQTGYILMLISFTADFIIQQNMNIIPSYWLAISPIPRSLGFPGLKVFDYIPPLKPFFVKPVIEAVDKFFAKVPENSRVFFSFSNPQDLYYKIFDGYRVLLEPAIYVGVRRNFLVMPNWYMIFKYNREGDPEFWGRTPDEVIDNMRKWNANFCVIYEGEGEKTNLDEWKEKGFKIISELNWKEMRKIYGEEFMLGYKLPKWYLLKYEQE